MHVPSRAWRCPPSRSPVIEDSTPAPSKKDEDEGKESEKTTPGIKKSGKTPGKPLSYPPGAFKSSEKNWLPAQRPKAC